MKRRFFHIPVHASFAGLFLAVLAVTCGWAGAGRDVQNRLDAAVRSWIGAGTTEAVVRAAARAYARYQHCGIGAAARLFWGAP